MTLRLFVAGASGQLATALRDTGLADSAYLIHSVGRPEFDITDKDAVELAIKEFNPDYIINAAAYTAVDLAEKDKDLARLINEVGARHLAVAAAKIDVPIIHLSTDYVFDGTKNEPYVEGDVVHPLGVYGKTKLAAEEALAEETDRHVILRTAWVYSHIGKNFVHTMINLARQKKQIRVVSDQIGNPTYAPSMAASILRIITEINKTPNNSRLFGRFHMTGTGDASWYDFACAIFEKSVQYGLSSPEVIPISTSDYPTAASRPANSRLSNEKLRSIYGIMLPKWQDDVDVCLRRIFADKEEKRRV